MEKRKHHRNQRESSPRKNPNTIIIGLIGIIVVLGSASLAFNLGQNIRENIVEEARMTQVVEAATVQAMSPIQVDENTLDHIVRFWSLDDVEREQEGAFSYGSCTGLITSTRQANQYDTDYVETKILTAKHCVKNTDDTITIAMPNGEIFSGRIYDEQALSPTIEDDASIVVTITSLPLVWEKLESLTDSPINLSPKPPVTGETVTVCGYPSAVQSYETHTTIFCRTATITGTEDGYITATDLPLSGGDSGGPWFNSLNQVFAVSRGGNPLDESNLTGFGLPINP